MVRFEALLSVIVIRLVSACASPAECGNGVVEGHEECDFGKSHNGLGMGGCTRSCTLPWAFVPAGRYEVGGPDDPLRTAGYSVRWPAAHEVETGGFHILATRVTLAQQRREGSFYLLLTAPWTGMTWREASGFCERIGARLPTDQEWEIAIRAGAPAAIQSADDDGGTCYERRSERRGSALVGLCPPNRFGVHDERGPGDWLLDCYSDPDDTETERRATERAEQYLTWSPCREHALRYGLVSQDADAINATEGRTMGPEERRFGLFAESVPSDLPSGVRCVRGPEPIPVLVDGLQPGPPVHPRLVVAVLVATVSAYLLHRLRILLWWLLSLCHTRAPPDVVPAPRQAIRIRDLDAAARSGRFFLLPLACGIGLAAAALNSLVFLTFQPDPWLFGASLVAAFQLGIGLWGVLHREADGTAMPAALGTLLLLFAGWVNPYDPFDLPVEVGVGQQCLHVATMVVMLTALPGWRRTLRSEIRARAEDVTHRVSRAEVDRWRYEIGWRPRYLDASAAMQLWPYYASLLLFLTAGFAYVKLVVVYGLPRVPVSAFGLVSPLAGAFGHWLVRRSRPFQQAAETRDGFHDGDMLLLRPFQVDHATLVPSEMEARAFVRRDPTVDYQLQGIVKQATAEGSPLLIVPNPRDYESGGYMGLLEVTGDWETDVRAWVRRAGFVVVVLGDTPGLLKELDIVVELDALHRTVFLAPPTDAVPAWRALENRIAALNDCPISTLPDVDRCLGLKLEPDGSWTLARGRGRLDVGLYLQSVLRNYLRAEFLAWRNGALRARQVGTF